MTQLEIQTKLTEEDLKDFDTEEKYIKFKAGRPKVLTFASFKKDRSEIVDSNTNEVKQIPAIICDIVKEDGEAVTKSLTITSKRLVQALRPYFAKGTGFTVEITQYGSGFDTEYEVRPREQ